jgi:uncharacterized coiled-coil DUF342 family protein
MNVINIRFIILQKRIFFKAIVRLGGNSLKVECDDWYGRNFDAEQRDKGLKCIKDEKRLALFEEELEEQSKKSTEQSKELAEQSKELTELRKKSTEQSKELTEHRKKSTEQSKKLAEQSKELAEIKQEQSNPVPKHIRGKY